MSNIKQTSKGKSEQTSIIEVDGKKVKVMDWHGYYIEVGANKSPFFLNEIQHRRNKQKANIMIITGSAGEGKTYFAIRLAEILDPKFDAETQIIFSRPELLHAIGEQSPFKRGQVIIIDEAHYGLGSRRWMESVQKDLMDALASVRSRGFIIIIVALHIDMLDVIVRKYVLNYMIHMEDRGVGVAYRLYTPRFAKELYKTRMGTIKLNLPQVELCAYPSCLACEYRDKCQTTRAIYERRKKAFVDEASKIAELRAEEIKQKQIKVSDKICVEKLYECEKELEWTSRGNVEVATIQLILEREFGITTGINKAKSLRRRLLFKYPSIARE